MNDSPDAITRLVRACDPLEALPADDLRYVNCDDVRGESVVESYVRSLRRGDPERPQVKLFAGHRGVGKTTELFRLKARLETPPLASGDRPFKVIYVETEKNLDLNDLDLPDLLVFVAAEAQRQLRETKIPGFTPVSTYLDRVWDDIKGALTGEVSLKEGKVDTGFGELTVELKNRPNSRARLREAIEHHSTNLLHGINDVLTTASVSLRQAGYEGLVLIVDGLERLVYRVLDDGASNTHVRLFCDRSEQLASLKARTIYTVPISLYYSPRCAQLVQALGEPNVPVPMIRLHESDSTVVEPDSPGMKKLWEMMEARCRYASVDIKDVFDEPATGHYLCQMTGGHPRHLLMLLRSALDAVDRLPVTRAAAEKAVRNYANSLLRGMPDSYWGKLRTFSSAKDDIPNDEDHQQMLFLLHVFEYMNGRPWYEVNPVIRTLPRFQPVG